jgi:spoIIIJ-associated protein
LEWVVTTGKTVEEALEMALDQLGVDEQDAEVEVIQEPQKGLFGRLRVEASVRARVRPSAPPPKVDRRERRRRGGERKGREGDRPARPRSRSGGRVGNGNGGGTGAAGAAGGAGAAVGEATALESAPLEAAGVDQDERVDQENGPRRGSGSRSGGGGAPRRRRSGRGDGRQAEGAREVSDTTTVGADEAPFDIQAQREAVEEFLVGLLGAFDRSDATVTVTVGEEDTLDASVDGEQLGVLVGQKGVTLQSVQELVRSMVQRRFVGETHARVRVDVAGYRERRRVALERFTAQVAESVLESGTAKALEPMGAADRKIVHDAVNAIDGVETVSEGEDAYRHVVIRPVS